MFLTRYYPDITSLVPEDIDLYDYDEERVSDLVTVFDESYMSFYDDQLYELLHVLDMREKSMQYFMLGQYCDIALLFSRLSVVYNLVASYYPTIYYNNLWILYGVQECDILLDFLELYCGGFGEDAIPGRISIMNPTIIKKIDKIIDQLYQFRTMFYHIISDADVSASTIKSRKKKYTELENSIVTISGDIEDQGYNPSPTIDLLDRLLEFYSSSIMASLNVVL